MLLVILPLFFQSATTEVQSPASPPTATASSEQAKPPEPKVVCTMQPITGTRASKARVCKDKAYEKNSDRAREEFDALQRKSGTNIPPLGGG